MPGTISPGVMEITLGSVNAGKVSPGTPVKIRCEIGYVGTLKVPHDGKGADAYLHASSWQLPFEIRVNDKAIYSEKLPGLSSPTAKWTKEAVWTPTPVYSGKTVWFECVVDPEQVPAPRGPADGSPIRPDDGGGIMPPSRSPSGNPPRPARRGPW